MQDSVCRALANLVANHDANRGAAVSCGVIPLLLEALKGHIGDQHVQDSAIRAIANIAVEADTKVCVHFRRIQDCWCVCRCDCATVVLYGVFVRCLRGMCCDCCPTVASISLCVWLQEAIASLGGVGVLLAPSSTISPPIPRWSTVRVPLWPI